jgi:hypothetical protein
MIIKHKHTTIPLYFLQNFTISDKKNCALMITKISFQLYLIIYHALAQQNHFDIEIYTYIATHFFAKNYQISVQVVKF